MRLQGRRGKWGKIFATFSFGSLVALSSAASGKEYVLKVKDSASFVSALQDLADSAQFTVKGSHPQGNLVKIDLAEGSQKRHAAILADLMKRDDVQYVVPNIKMQMFGEPNDPRYSEQWSLAKVNAAGAWDVTAGSRDVVVAVIDTGVDYKHPDLEANIWTNADEVAGNGVDDDNNGFIDDVHGWDFKEKDADPQDETSDKNPGHGTHCAGIMGAVGNNGVGVSGMSQAISIMPIRFLGSDGSGDLYSAASSIDYAINNGAHIISASWGAAVPASGAAPIIEAIGRANDKGVIFIAAAANDGKSNDTREVYPANANLPNMISVAASQSDDSKPSWSNFGKAKVHLASPGHEILSTFPNNTFGSISGTSMATPLVSGLAALLVSKALDDGQTLDGLTVRSLLQTTGAQVAIETACDCRVDAAAAINALQSSALTVVPAALTLAPSETQQFKGFGGKAPYTFTSANTAVATITATGALTAAAEGETTLTITDAGGATAQSLKVRVAKASEGGGEACPLEDPMMCQLMCAIEPTLPWCAR